jgi:hypothetical protein
MSPNFYFLALIPLIISAQFMKFFVVQFSAASSFPRGLNCLYSSKYSLTVVCVLSVGWRNKFLETFKCVQTCHFVYGWQYPSSGEINLFEGTSHPCLMHFANTLFTPVRTMNLEVWLNPLHFSLYWVSPHYRAGYIARKDWRRILKLSPN